MHCPMHTLATATSSEACPIARSFCPTPTTKSLPRHLHPTRRRQSHRHRSVRDSRRVSKPASRGLGRASTCGGPRTSQCASSAEDEQQQLLLLPQSSSLKRFERYDVSMQPLRSNQRAERSLTTVPNTTELACHVCGTPDTHLQCQIQISNKDTGETHP